MLELILYKYSLNFETQFKKLLNNLSNKIKSLKYLQYFNIEV